MLGSRDELSDPTGLWVLTVKGVGFDRKFIPNKEEKTLIFQGILATTDFPSICIR